MAFYSKYHRISHKTPKGFRMFNIYNNPSGTIFVVYLRIITDIEPKLFRIFAPSKTKKLKI